MRTPDFETTVTWGRDFDEGEDARLLTPIVRRVHRAGLWPEIEAKVDIREGTTIEASMSGPREVDIEWHVDSATLKVTDPDGPDGALRPAAGWEEELDAQAFEEVFGDSIQDDLDNGHLG